MSNNSKGVILEVITEILERSISDDSSGITKNKKIKDLDGVVREIDIYVESIINKRKFNLAIECKNYKEPISLDKIEAFYAKCSKLPQIHKKIFLTTSNYQKGAIIKAKSFGIELYRITTEKIDETNNLLGIDNVSSFQKKLKILSLRFECPDLFEKKIFPNKKLNLFHEDGTFIPAREMEDSLYSVPEIWKLLNTNSGLLLNKKKSIYQKLSITNAYTKYNETLYTVDSVQLKIEIEYEIKPMEIDTLKKYVSISDNTTLATFSDFEFIKDGINHRFCYVKPNEESEGKFFVTSKKHQNPIELKTLATFKDEPRMISTITKDVQNVKITPYEFNISRKAVKNSLAESQVAPEGENSKFLDKIKRKGTSTLFGLDKENKKIFFMIPFSHNSKLISAKFPEPISMFFNHAIELCNKAQYYKNIMVANSPDDESVLLQDESYHKYLQNLISSIFMLHSAIELFVNSCIKDDFEIERDGRCLTKKEIEEGLSLLEKIEDIVPKICDFVPKQDKKLYTTLSYLTELNEELQNLQTSDSINQPFLDSFERLISFNLNECFDIVKFFFKKVNRNYNLIED